MENTPVNNEMRIIIKSTTHHVETYQDPSVINTSFKISAIGATNREMPTRQDASVSFVEPKEKFK